MPTVPPDELRRYLARILQDETWRQIGEAAASVGVGPYEGPIREGG